MLRNKEVDNIAQTAVRLDCSKRTVHSCIAKLRRDGFNIQFDRRLKRYVLLEED